MIYDEKTQIIDTPGIKGFGLVDFDKSELPEKISWSATDGGVKNKESKAVFLSVWDHEPQETLKIDLWTKDMPLDQMNVFFHQTLVSMSETFFKATQNEKIDRHHIQNFQLLLNLKQNYH